MCNWKIFKTEKQAIDKKRNEKVVENVSEMNAIVKDKYKVKNRNRYRIYRIDR